MDEKPIRVIDISLDTTPEQAEELLCALDAEYYLHTLVSWGATGARAFFRQRATPRKGAETPGRPGPKKSALTLADDATAEAFLRSHGDMSNRSLSRSLYERHQINRSYQWMQRRRAQIAGTHVSV